MKLYTDKADDISDCRRSLLERRIGDRIAHRDIVSSARLGRHHWAVEGTITCYKKLANCDKLLVLMGARPSGLTA